MKLYNDEWFEVQDLNEYYELTRDRVIGRIIEFGYDEAFDDVEKANPDGMEEDAFIDAVCERAEEIAGWDFFEYDNPEEYEEELALAFEEICEWDDR